MAKTDIILLIPLLWGIYWGVYKGIISQLTSFAGIIIAAYVSIKYYSYIATFINAHVDEDTSQHYVAIGTFVVVFIAVLLIIFLISKQIEKLTKVLNIGFLNHIAGGIFGLVKWAVIVSIVLILLNLFSQETNEKYIDFHNTWAYNHLLELAPKLMPNVFNKLSN
jgi:membrane protein required for colicin V production